MLKFVTSFDEEKVKIKNIIMDEISNNQKYLKKLEDGCKESTCRNIDNYLDKAIFTSFKGLVIIDDARNELFKVLEKINANISVLELKTYKSGNGEFAYEFDTLYEEDEEIPQFNINIEEKINENERQKRRNRRAQSDTIIIPAREDGFYEEFINNNQWYAIRIGAAMKEKIKYIAAYQVAPISAVTHIAKIKEIRPYKDSGKYLIVFEGPAEKIPYKKLKNSNKSPQSPVYTKYEKLINSKTLDEAMEL